MPYVAEGEHWRFSDILSKIADIVSECLGDVELLARMSSKAKLGSRSMVPGSFGGENGQQRGRIEFGWACPHTACPITVAAK